MALTIDGTGIPDSKLARAVTELARDTLPPLLFHHSSRAYYFGALAGKRRSLRFDAELLYAGAMFHDMGLVPTRRSPKNRFEVDGANAAREFLHAQGIAQNDVDLVWTAIALHTTPGIPEHMHPVISLVNAGVAMDVVGETYADYADAQREEIVRVHPRGEHFPEDIIATYYDTMKRKPETTFGTINANVIADKEPLFRLPNFCALIRHSAWSDSARAPSSASPS